MSLRNKFVRVRHLRHLVGMHERTDLHDIQPLAITRSSQSQLRSAVGTTCFSTCSPSRGPTSWIRSSPSQGFARRRGSGFPGDGFAHFERRRRATHVVRAHPALVDDRGGRRFEPGGLFAVSPSQSSIILADRMVAIGFTLYWPAYFGALPWLGSNTPSLSPMLAEHAKPESADHLRREVADDVAEEVRRDHHAVVLRSSSASTS